MGHGGASADRSRSCCSTSFAFPGLVSRHRDLITTSVRARAVRSRFTGDAPGLGLAAGHPAALIFAIFYVIFSKLLSFKFSGLPPEEQEAAMGVYMLRRASWSGPPSRRPSSRSTGVFVDNGNLIKKVAFPSEILPLNLVLVNLVTMLFGDRHVRRHDGGSRRWSACTSVADRRASIAMLLWVLLLLLAMQALFTYGLGTDPRDAPGVPARHAPHRVGRDHRSGCSRRPIFWAPQIVAELRSLGGFRRDRRGSTPMYHLVYAWRLGPDESPAERAHGRAPRRFGRRCGTSSARGSRSPWRLLGAWAVGELRCSATPLFLLGRRRFADEI